MAKRYGRFGVLAICVLLFNCYLCAAIENPEFERYDIDSFNKVHLGSYLSIEKLRQKRETTLDNKNQYESVSQNATSLAKSNNSSTTTVVAQAPITTSTDKPMTSVGVPYNDQPLLGANGTGQRKDYSGDAATKLTTTVVSEQITPNADDATSNKKTNQLYPKKVGATPFSSPNPTSENDEDQIIGKIDIPDSDAEKAVDTHNFTMQQDYHIYYNSTIYVNQTVADQLWKEVKNITHNLMLSNSHRRAMTVELTFDFPFYGHHVRNITVATGGFLYTGEYVHSWLAATQYIAPLMANFDTSLSNDSFVRINDNGTAFTVVWENATLQDKKDKGRFTFSATLHKSGDIVFAYYNIPVTIKSIEDDQHPVKVGLSDAYIVDKMVYFARRKTIYEYHRVNFAGKEITNSTIIYLTALRTCHSYTDCQACINHATTFDCAWCPTLNRCSTGTDRKKQEWLQKGCDRTIISDIAACPALGQKGNNATQANTSNSKNDANSNNKSPNNDSKANSNTQTTNSNHNADDTKLVDDSISSSTISSLNSALSKEALSEHVQPANMSVTLGLSLMICFVLVISLWVLYAYRNPHTKSGQLLIQYRPSQWSWRRGEARYTAATIHM